LQSSLIGRCALTGLIRPLENGLLGAIVPTIDNTMFARGIASLQKYLSSIGYMLLLTSSGHDLDAELQQARSLISRGVDGPLPRARMRS
jgi:DNA-binding LacI/PurR family transcriptional regulator